MLESEIRKYRGVGAAARPQRPPHTNDFARLARRICGKSIGVVLGGGGARGISHLVEESFRRPPLYLTDIPRAFFVLWRIMGSQLTMSRVSISDFAAHRFFNRSDRDKHWCSRWWSVCT